jgi:IS30 family transposase
MERNLHYSKRFPKFLGVDYYAKTYYRWERKANKNVKGLIKQYFSKE